MCKQLSLASLWKKGWFFSHWLGCVRIYLAGQVRGATWGQRGGPRASEAGWVQAQLCRCDAGAVGRSLQSQERVSPSASLRIKL